jgi:hypothetical protein
LWAVVVPQQVLAHAPGQDAPVDEVEQARRAAAEQALREQQEQAAREAERRARELDLERMREFQRDVAVDVQRAVNQSAFIREVQRKQRFEDFQNALRDFATANTDFRESLGTKSVKRQASTMAKSTGTFLDYIKLLIKERVKLDTSEFRDFSEKELAWEALTTAERILPHLQSLLVGEDQMTVDVRFLKSLAELQKDLLRLQWMARRIK